MCPDSVFEMFASNLIQWRWMFNSDVKNEQQNNQDALRFHFEEFPVELLSTNEELLNTELLPPIPIQYVIMSF